MCMAAVVRGHAIQSGVPNALSENYLYLFL